MFTVKKSNILSWFNLNYRLYPLLIYVLLKIVNILLLIVSLEPKKSNASNYEVVSLTSDLTSLKIILHKILILKL